MKKNRGGRNVLVTEKQYLTLSKLAYANFINTGVDTNIGKSLGQINFPEILSANAGLWSDLINEMSDWQLLAYATKNDQSGFCGTAFKNQTTGEIVFALRGTEPSLNYHLLIPEDFLTDAQIALGGSSIGKPNQFKDTYDFIKNTMANIYNNGEDMNNDQLIQILQQTGTSFTGHSLGGGLSQYLSFTTGQRSVTFNGVGIWQALDTDIPANQFNVLDIVNADDIIGNFGIQLGQTRYIKGNISVSSADARALSEVINTITEMRKGTMGKIEKLLAIKHICEAMNENTKGFLLRQCRFEAHGLESFFCSIDPSNNLTQNNVATSEVQNLCDALMNASRVVSQDMSKFSTLQHLVKLIDKKAF